MRAAVFVALACEADLTLAAAGIGVSLSGRSRTVTVFATAAAALAVTLGVYLLWALWFVGPPCVVGGNGCTLPAASFAWAGSVAAAQWLWMRAVALGARFAKNGNLANVSG